MITAAVFGLEINLQPGSLQLPMTYIHVDQTPGNQRKGRHCGAGFHGSASPIAELLKLGGDKHEVTIEPLGAGFDWKRRTSSGAFSRRGPRASSSPTLFVGVVRPTPITPATLQ